MRKWLGFICVLALLVTVIGCGTNNNASTNNSDNTALETPAPASEAVDKPAVKPEPVQEKLDPVTLKVIVTVSKNEYAYIEEAVKNQWPHITLEVVGDNTIDFAKQLATGIEPDLLIVGEGGARNADKVDLVEDLNPYVEKFGYDLGLINSGLIETTKALSTEGKLLGLPIIGNFSALYYNKDIFDMFGVDYPTDNMTWQDAIDLTAKVTGTKDGVQYKGLQLTDMWRLKSPLGLNFADEEAQKSLLNTEEWKYVFETLAPVYSIPGNEPIDPADFKAGSSKGFFDEKVVAMFPNGNQLSILAERPELNWDVVTLPSYDKAPGVGFNITTNLLTVTSTSKHKDDAFRVVLTSVSEEVQNAISANGVVPSLSSAESTFASNYAGLESKNLAAVFATKQGTPHKTMPFTWNGVGNTQSGEAFNNVVFGREDINTALRKADEILNAEIKKTLGQ